MNSNKDISELIKESEHKLASPPSPNAWAKLDRKLKKRQIRRHLRFIHPLSMAASVAILVAIVATIGYLGNKQISQSSENADFFAAPFEMEEIPSSEMMAEIPDRKKVVEYISSFEARGNMPINEGDEYQELIIGD